MPPEAGIGYTEKGSVVLLPAFLDSAVGRTKPAERAVYLWFAQQANHPPQPIKLNDGRTTLTVQRGEWFGGYRSLSDKLGLHQRTLRRILGVLSAIGEYVMRNFLVLQRYPAYVVREVHQKPHPGDPGEPSEEG